MFRHEQNTFASRGPDAGLPIIVGCISSYWINVLPKNTRYKVFRHVETLFVQGRNLYLAGLLLVGGK